VRVADFVRRPAAALARRRWLRRRDGVPGMILSLIESFGEVLAAAKRWERKALLEQHLTSPAGVRLPRGFVALKTPTGWMVVRRDVDERLLAALHEATPDAPLGERIAVGGRGGAFLITVGNGRRAVLRWYRRGGAVRRLLRDRYLGWRPRPIVELALTEEARRRGIATAEVLGVRVDRAGPGVYRGVIVTQAIDHATTLDEVLRAPLDADARAAVLDAVARAVRLMHERGVHHRDLNVGNVLVVRERGTLVVHLIDFDRAQIRGLVPARVRRRALRRLDRSLAKLNRGAEVISAAERARVVRTYWEPA
jgi:tRNA A-37 threonylcarbamoyl transferase component Bud32